MNSFDGKNLPTVEERAPVSPGVETYCDAFCWFVSVFLLGSSDQRGAWTPAPPWLPLRLSREPVSGL